jgi:hypothetical protein
MGRKRLTLNDLRRVLRSYGVSEDSARGKGGHTYFFKRFEDGEFGYPVPTTRELNQVYVKGARRKFRLTTEDGVSDDDFFSRV